MVSVCCRNLAVLVLLLGFSLAHAVNPPVKQSSSGICHPPVSSYYERTGNFTPFQDLESCLSAGGRLPKGLTLSRADPSVEYQRSEFGHGWSDEDGDCQDSRAEALIQSSSTTVRFADASRCRVVTGRWISPFTGNVIQNAGDIDIDHVVPLAWAWERGANTWPRVERERFANDPVNLWPVEAHLNRSKGARGPDEWMPPAGRCQYVARFVRIVKSYGLQPDATEAARFQQLLDGCRG
ncbi:Protein of unknown function [Marinobacter daqiaonensis]|uniref:GmrSD restriction endonucleases C-terminal domain-containing protein n=1 Tax=Marinobacter daqiaonensis TaxID=650891 RepID=A0A1I6I5E1_9GAMM|nr:HNH endonuclease family protein [Marinobacter daqiaonensis]SFR61967.1 Protein of unknown function [Marinobacter daqiaonensis]